MDAPEVIPMSTPSAPLSTPAAESVRSRVPSRSPCEVFAWVVSHPATTPFQALGFWMAVVLPFVHVPLFATGLTSPTELQLFAQLIALNCLAFLVGHRHKRD